MSLQSSVFNPQSGAVPQHIGLILDGNRRWALEKGLQPFEGHKKGYETLKEICEHAYDVGVKYVSAYVFSTENWNRTKEEVSFLLNFVQHIATYELQQLLEKDIKIIVLGSEERVPKKIIKVLRRVEEQSKHNTGGVLALCFNYGGLQEVADATKKVVASGIKSGDITVDVLLDNLYHPELPSVDLTIRTSGEQRISNFMLARLAYSELYFSTKLWPDFSRNDLDEALAWYAARDRRHGA